MTRGQEQQIWHEGYWAYINGYDNTECPYTKDAECEAWMSGYNHAMNYKGLHHIYLQS